MTKRDIADRIQKKLGTNAKDSAILLETVLKLIVETLETGKDVKLSGFGKFQIKQKRTRKGRNPQTGEPMAITARRVVTFKASDILKKNINLPR